MKHYNKLKICFSFKIAYFYKIGLISGKGHGSSVMFSDGDHIGHISASKDVSFRICVYPCSAEWGPLSQKLSCRVLIVYNYILTLNIFI